MGADLDRMLTDYNLSTLFLAKKLESLPPRIRENIFNQIETAIEQLEQLSAAIGSGAITPIDRLKLPRK